MRDEDLQDKSIRPNVRKHYRTFEGYVRIYGAENIRQLLDKGKATIDGKTYRLTFLKNRKDIWQMMQLLDLCPPTRTNTTSAAGAEGKVAA